jgi:hypothetical protein
VPGADHFFDYAHASLSGAEGGSDTAAEPRDGAPADKDADQDHLTMDTGGEPIETPPSVNPELDDYLAAERSRDQADVVHLPSPPTKSVFEQANEERQETDRDEPTRERES